MTDRDPTPTQRIRVAVRAGRRSGALPGEEVAAPASMTRQIRAGRKQRRRRFAPERAPVVYVPPWRDAAFPALASLLFTGPVAVRWIAAGNVAGGIAVALGGALIAFGTTYALSPWLDGGGD